jgi:hypothetical protein
MRAGLLTRFMGVLGIIIGVLVVIPIGPLPVVQTFWLIALGALLLGFWPGAGVPPAWRSGRAEPWPSSGQVTEQRRAARAGRGRAASAPAADEASAPAAAVAGSPRRKRKRRR